MSYDYTADRRDPIHLRDYLEWLFPRIKTRAHELAQGYLPRFKSGSVMGMTDLKHETDSLDDTPVMDLVVALLEWKGEKPFGSTIARVRRGLETYMAKNRISDVDLLLGSDKAGKGLVEQTRREVKLLLAPSAQELEGARNMRAGVERCYALAMLLKDWLDSDCVHEWESISDDPKIAAERCVKCDLTKTDVA